MDTSIEPQIVAILKTIRPETDFSASQDFVADGLLDSFDLVSLVSEIDEKFSISIEGTNIVPENFCNLRAICALVGATLEKKNLRAL